jgi:hypothetical protein
MFWDKLVWPMSRAVHFPSGPDAQFLEQANILRRPEYTVNGDVAQGIARGQIQAFIDLDQREPGLWSLAQGENSLLLKEQMIHEGSGASVELHRAIPVPDHDVPLNDILEFRRKRYDELQLLRNELDTFAAAVNAAEDKAAELAKHIASADVACADAIKVAKEWHCPVRLSNFKASIDLRPFSSVAAAFVGWTAGAEYGLPLVTALLFGAGASLKIGGDFGVQRIRPRPGPYRYVAQFHQDVF